MQLRHIVALNSMVILPLIPFIVFECTVTAPVADDEQRIGCLKFLKGCFASRKHENALKETNGEKNIHYVKMDNAWQSVGGLVLLSDDGYGMKLKENTFDGFAFAKTHFSYHVVRTMGVTDDSYSYAMFYFEIEIRVMNSEPDDVSVGLGENWLLFDSTGGYTDEFGEYHQNIGIEFAEGDTIGIGLILPPAKAIGKSAMMFQTKNGSLSGKYIAASLHILPAIPHVLLWSKAEVMSNFGKTNFKYNIQEHALPKDENF